MTKLILPPSGNSVPSTISDPKAGTLAGRLKATGREVAILSPSVQGALDRIKKAESAALMERSEMLRDGHPAVEIACDHSASSIMIEEGLRTIASKTASSIKEKNGLSKITFGIYGGSGLVKARQSEGVLSEEHRATDAWESTFDKYLLEYAKNLDTTRQNILISFHDARTNNSEELKKAVGVLNEKGVIVVIGYVPTSEEGSEDGNFLRDLADNKTGLRRGVFIDFSGVDLSNAEVMQRIIEQIVEAVKISNGSAAKESQGDDLVATQLAQTKLKCLVEGIMAQARAKSLQGSGSQHKLLK